MLATFNQLILAFLLFLLVFLITIVMFLISIIVMVVVTIFIRGLCYLFILIGFLYFIMAEIKWLSKTFLYFICI